MKTIEDLVQKLLEAKREKQRLEFDLMNAIEIFDGTLLEALSLGIVKLGFSAPREFNRKINQQ